MKKGPKRQLHQDILASPAQSPYAPFGSIYWYNEPFAYQPVFWWKNKQEQWFLSLFLPILHPVFQPYGRTTSIFILSPWPTWPYLGLFAFIFIILFPQLFYLVPPLSSWSHALPTRSFLLQESGCNLLPSSTTRLLPLQMASLGYFCPQSPSWCSHTSVFRGIWSFKSW